MLHPSCVRDFLVYPLLLSSLDQPQAIIGLAENQARLFGVPLVRAVNLEDTDR